MLQLVAPAAAAAVRRHQKFVGLPCHLILFPHPVTNMVKSILRLDLKSTSRENQMKCTGGYHLAILQKIAQTIQPSDCSSKNITKHCDLFTMKDHLWIHTTSCSKGQHKS